MSQQRRKTRRSGGGGGGRPRSLPGGPVEADVVRLGEGGDGIAETKGGRLYVPLTVPGDRVWALPMRPRSGGFAARLLQVVTAGPGRAQPPCPHFGVCGGCALQHLADDAYAAWKVARVTTALARVGLADCRIGPLVRTPRGSRRRATFAAARSAGGAVQLGFQVREAHRIVDLAVCPVLEPAIVALLAPLRRLLGGILPAGARASVSVALLDSGLDVLLQGWSVRSAGELERLAEFAAEADLARLSWQAAPGAPIEPLVLRRPALTRFAGVPVAVPPAGFLQASVAGEAALLAAVRAGIGSATAVCDLFCGSGTFALPLALAGAHVHGVDGDADAIAPLATAGRSATALASRLSCEQRDLFARPLATAELARYAAVVLDPPRAGARAQAATLAASAAPRVVYVSCNPATFARDARLLADGGYRLEEVTPVDQFLWSPHVELAALFRRPMT